MLTLDQAKLYLEEALGIAVPDFALQAAVDDVAARESAMTAAGYTAATIVRIQCMAAALLAGADFVRRVQSQGAPSGASRSFKHAEAMTQLRRSLSSLDTAGTVASLVGPDPKAGTLLLVTC
jgi:hypothetical protein